jgi:hypothetical protein
MAAHLAQEGTKVPNRSQEPIPNAIRRFTLADLSQHGAWIAQRLMKLRPELTDRQLRTWLTNLIESNAHLFLYQPHAVALAEVVREESLAGKPVVRERFVFMQEGHDAEAAEFYVEFMRWAGSLGAEQVIVEEMTDVPHELVRAKVGRVFERKQFFARV